LVAEGFEEVVAAFEQLARERKARAVAADPLGELKAMPRSGLAWNRARCAASCSAQRSAGGRPRVD
jgi:hypothetical protein